LNIPWKIIGLRQISLSILIFQDRHFDIIILTLTKISSHAIVSLKRVIAQKNGQGAVPLSSAKKEGYK